MGLYLIRAAGYQHRASAEKMKKPETKKLEKKY
jgi:hypothetical protein